MSFLDLIHDSWVNLVTGFGTTRDRSAYSAFATGCILSDTELTALCNEDGLANRIVNLLPQTAFREGYTVSDPAAEKAAETLGVNRVLFDAWRWARQYGGALVVLGYDGPQDQPPAPGASLRYVDVWDKREVVPDRYYPGSYRPLIWRLNPVNGGQGGYVHESRTIVFQGLPTDVLTRRLRNGWDLPILGCCYDALRAFNNAHGSVNNLLDTASQGVFKLKGLIASLANKQSDKVITRLSLMDQARSTAKAVILDSEGEDFSYVSSAFGGVGEALDRKANLLAGTSGYPVTLLFGQAPAGLNATGDNDVRAWYDTVRSDQRTVLLPALRRIYRDLAGGKDVDIHFRPLWQPTAKERAEERKTVADTDIAYVQEGILTEAEVRASRFGSGQWCADTVIDPAIPGKTTLEDPAAVPATPAGHPFG